MKIQHKMQYYYQVQSRELALWRVTVVVLDEDGNDHMRREIDHYVGAKTASEAAQLVLLFEEKKKKKTSSCRNGYNVLFVQQILRVHNMIIFGGSWLEIPISVLDLSNRVRLALARKGVETLEDVQRCISGDWDKGMGGIGPKSLSELHSAFDKFMQEHDDE